MKTYSKFIWTVVWFVAFLSLFGFIGMSRSPSVAIVGDSYALRLPPEQLAGDVYAVPGASIMQLYCMVQRLPERHYDTVYIFAGVANENQWHATRSETKKAIHDLLVPACKKTFRTDNIIICSPDTMWQLMEIPEYREADSLHLNRQGYVALIGTLNNQNTSSRL